MACIALSCIGLAACSKPTKIDELEKEGNVVSVTYNSNGGMFTGRSGVSVVNMFNPENFKDSNGDGKVEISLKKTDPALFDDVGAPAKNGYFFAGWFKTCEPLTVNGEPVDDYGNVLEAGEGGLYYIKGTKTRANRAYSYSDMWDFDNDKIEYAQGDGSYKLTLYAGWVPNYQFDYYYQEKGEWKLLGSTTFDYSRTQAFKDSYDYTTAIVSTYDFDKIWVPKWSGENETGEMVNTHSYADGKTNYTFPKYAAHTFVSAYTDKECTNKITDELTHGGSLAYDKASNKLVVNNLVRNVYVEFEEGEQYRISSAEEFVKYAAKANKDSVYTIMSPELDFGQTEDGKLKTPWPAALTSGEFAGKIIGNDAVFKNVSATNSSPSAAYGGLFGAITGDAVIKNITFENVTYDMATGSNARNATAVYFGIFAGEIETGAEVSGITVNNSTLKIGTLSINPYKINLVCGSGKGNISYSNLSVEIVGERATIEGETKYRYFVTNPTVNEETGAVSVTIQGSSLRTEIKDTESYIAYPVNND